ncbi:MAG TPA: uracil phosphoribosyltransferase [Gammaproteobacteria bacterium]|nr:uracil phosphoribosyltransferase [Gammaproteobacteria bacterium]
MFPNLIEVKHPLLLHKLSSLRETKTSTKEFSELTREITLLLAYEATKDLPITTKHIKTPLESFDAPFMQGKKPVILPILRAGLGMVDGFLTLMPSARVGHIGLYRDEETLLPQFYYFKIPPKSSDRQFFICDPMLATGGSAVDTINRLKKAGIKKMIFVCLVAAPEGVKKMLEAHPDVKIYTASLDRELNSHGYILPGLGDAGDRLFGTK